MPTSFEDAERVVQQRVETLWVSGGLPRTPVAWTNVDHVNLMKGEDTWVRVNMLEGDGEQTGMGTSLRRWRQVGILSAQIFVVMNTGTRAAKALGDLFAAMFRGVTVEGIVFQSPSVKEVGRSEDWFQVNASVPYYWDLDA